MAKYDPTFWEVSVDPAILEEVLLAPDDVEQLFIAPETDNQDVQELHEQQKQAAITLIHELILTELTPRQRQIMQMYFYDNKTQQEIAAELGINQQVVSKHLFGVLRNGRKVGGALKKLRKLCEQAGVDPQKWV